MRKAFGKCELIGYAVFAALFLAVAGLWPAHAADWMKPADIISPP